MPATDEYDIASAVAEQHRPSISAQMGEKHLAYGGDQVSMTSDGSEPTMEEMKTLRRVSGEIGWRAFSITFVEFCERFSWYGTTAVFVNFIQHPRPYGSPTGAINLSPECIAVDGRAICEQPGGLGQDQRASTGLTTFNQFWAYVMPLLGGYLADTFLGRFNTIQMAIAFAVVGHIILIVSSIPTVMDNEEGALGCFAVGLVLMGVGTGCFKSNISPLLAEQLPQKRPEIITTKSGERVIKDPAVTLSRAMLYFYMMINIGSLVGGIGMVYAERYIGFWLSYALPTFLFFVAPVVLLGCKKQYKLSPPTGDVTSKAFGLLFMASKGCWSLNPMKTYNNFHREGFWDRVKPSNLGPDRPKWMAGIDDAWVDQVARGFNACKVFFWLPLYWLAYSQMVGNLTSQSATMSLNGVPNDLINNLNPLTLVVFIPLIDKFFYPAFRKANIRFTPIKRMACGFFVASAAMVSSTVMQYYIYKLSDCPRNFVNEGMHDGVDCTAPINAWAQAVPYCLIAFSEVFASITGLEYAIGKAPENMRGLVMGVNLLQTAFSAAIGQALVPLAEDPLLIWNYGVVAVLAFIGGVGFWLTWKDLDAKEDELNLLAETTMKGRHTVEYDAENKGELFDTNN